jgi:hypothetical protein
VPLVVLLTAANIPDGVLLEALVDDLPAIRMPTGHRRRRPGKLYGDKAYDSRGDRRALRLRYERSDARFYAFVLLACSLLSF